MKKGYTAPDRLVIQGGSAGGLLMGAVTNLRPDLFKAVVTQVPFVDVLTTMLDASLPLTVQEYLEWGNPNVKTYYQYMRSYSPYDNLKKRAYPAMLVETSLNDSQVMYWEPAKYVAKLRDAEDRRQRAPVEDHPRGRPRRRLGPLRRAEGARLHVLLRPGPGRPGEMISLCLGRGLGRGS